MSTVWPRCRSGAVGSKPTFTTSGRPRASRLAQVVQSDDVDAALRETLDLLVDSHRESVSVLSLRHSAFVLPSDWYYTVSVVEISRRHRAEGRAGARRPAPPRARWCTATDGSATRWASRAWTCPCRACRRRSRVCGSAFSPTCITARMVPADLVSERSRCSTPSSPDLIVLGGDYVSFGDRAYMAPVAERLGALAAPHGVFGIIGNHDDERVDAGRAPTPRHRDAAGRPHDARAQGRAAGSGRREVLDEDGGRDRACRCSGATAPVLLLAHDPRRIVEAAALAVAGVLAGHTHGGQVVLPVRGRRWPRGSFRSRQGA